MKAWYAGLPPVQQRTVRAAAWATAVLSLSTLLRECVLPPDLDVAWVSADRKWSVTADSTPSGADPEKDRVISFARAEKSCDFHCVGDEDMCRGFMKRFDFHCTAAAPRDRPANIEGSVAFLETPDCFTPLVKMGSTSFNLSMNVAVDSRLTERAGSFRATGEVDQTAKGIMSCARFKREMGELAYQAVDGDMRRFMMQN